MRYWILGVCILAQCAAFAALVWEEQVHDGVTVCEYALEKPRTMKVFVARVDLTTPGIGFTATERLNDGWREPIRTDDTSTDTGKIAIPTRPPRPPFASTRLISIVGDTLFASLYGECRYEIIGFVADEALALSNNVEIVLSAAKAAWLNKCGGDKATVQLAASGLSAKDFDDAYILNLDITDGSRSYAFAITDIAVGDTSVTVAVTLARTGKIEQATNGTLKFYGAATLAGFKAAASPLGSAVLSDDDFSNGDSATATIPLDGEAPPAFFKAKIEE